MARLQGFGLWGGGRVAGNEDRLQGISSSNPFPITAGQPLDEKRDEQSNRHFSSNHRLVVLNGFVVEANFFFFLAAPHCLWDFSSPTRDRTQALSGESAESQPLDRQGIPEANF